MVVGWEGCGGGADAGGEWRETTGESCLNVERGFGRACTEAWIWLVVLDDIVMMKWDKKDNGEGSVEESSN